MFDVPVGAARGGGEAVNRPAPGRAAVLFGDQARPRGGWVGWRACVCVCVRVCLSVRGWHKGIGAGTGFGAPHTHTYTYTHAFPLHTRMQMGYGPFHGARLAVHLLRSLDPAGLAAQQQGQQQGGSSTGSSGEGGSSSARAAASAASASAAAGHLEHLTALLEQYYHPSNTGEGSR